MIRLRHTGLHRLGALVLASLVTGCGAGFLSGASSMRVEVEVYKGPLSKSLPAQMGDLAGIAEETRQSLLLWKDAALAARDHLLVCAHQREGEINADEGVKAARERGNEEEIEAARLRAGKRFDEKARPYLKDCLTFDALVGQHGISKDLIASVRDVIKEQRLAKLGVGRMSNLPAKQAAKLAADIDTLVRQSRVNQLVTGLESIVGGVEGFEDAPAKADGSAGKAMTEDGKKADLRAFALNASKVAARLKAKAFHRAFSEIANINDNPILRRIYNDFALVTSEFSNQTASRADVLYKQTGDKARSAATLATSDYLRDSSTTRFVNLYDWLLGATDQWQDEVMLGRDDKVRLANQLFSDYYWSKVNEVHASGQGDVQMALVKDEIGNWNLKSFSNDPAELLQAYTDVGRALIQTAITVAGGGLAGAPNAAQNAAQQASASQRLLSAARRATLGGPSGAGSANQELVERLRADTVARLQAADAGGGKRSVGNIQFTAQRANNDTITIAGEQFTYVQTANPNAQREIVIGTDLAATLAATVSALDAASAADTAGENVGRADYTASDDTLNIVHKVPGTDGDTFQWVVSANANPSSGHLTGGAGRPQAELRADVTRILREYEIQIETLQQTAVPPPQSP